MPACRAVSAILCLVLLMAMAPAAFSADGESQAGAAAGSPQTVRSVGSDTMGELLAAWAAGFAESHPEISIDISAEGSATAPPALLSGNSDIAPMSREMSDAEIAQFEAMHGYAPVGIQAALGAIAIYVHKDNPLFGITLGQLDRIFSETHLCGGDDITEWDQVAHGVRNGRTIKLHGRNEISGTYRFFQDHALCGGTFKPNLVLHNTSRELIDAIAADPDAIGYAGLGFRTEEVRTVALARGNDPNDNARYFPLIVERNADDPDPAKRHAYVVDGRYPLSRPLLIYVDKAPGETLSEPVTKFLDYVLSADGQYIVEKNGFVPLSNRRLEDERKKLKANYRPRKSWF